MKHFLFFFLLSLPGHAQIPNLSGDWSGTTQTLSGTYQVFDHIQQKGLTLSGYGKIVNVQKTDSSAYQFEGYIKGDDIQITLTKFIYKSPLACLSKIKLKYRIDDQGDYLFGKWGGNLVFGGCLPGIGGKVELMKEQPVSTAVSIAVSQEIIEKADLTGQALADRLNQANYYALFIGIEDYTSAGVSVLNQPVADGMKLLDVLQQQYTFNPEHSIFLKNPDRTSIIESFEALSKVVTSKDQVLIFYAGHGVWDQELEQGYWLPVDASLESRANWLSNSTIRDYLRGIQSRHTLLITDACFSGGILKERAVFANSKAMLELYNLPSRKAITSGTLTAVPDNSVFIKYLIKNLLSNTQPMLSASELFNDFKIAVINNSPSGQVPQLGVIGQCGDEGGEFIFLNMKK